MKAAFYTLGCKVNQYDTEAMREILESAGYTIVEFDDDADVYIINTCTVTNIADKKSRQMIRKANKNAIVGVCGCLSQRNADEVLKIQGVNFVFGTQNRANILNYINIAMNSDSKLNFVDDIQNTHKFEHLVIRNTGERTRAHIKICDGCNNYCSYCIIPYARGPERSRNAEDVISEAKTLAQNGVKEIVLTGIHISSYGSDLKNINLIGLLEKLNLVDGIERIRLGSIEQKLITEEFCIRAGAIEKLCPHFHVSLQSGSSSVLKRMNRKYTADEYAYKIELLRKYFDRPAITTDIITGFPAETEQEHAETLEFVKRIGFARVHVFPYSERSGTKAAEMTPVVPSQIRKSRAAEIISAAQETEKTYVRSLLGLQQSVLIEENGVGYTERYVRALAKGDEGCIIKIVPNIVEDNILKEK